MLNKSNNANTPSVTVLARPLAKSISLAVPTHPSKHSQGAT